MKVELEGIPSRGHRFTDSMCLKNLLYVLALESEGGIIRREGVNEILAEHDGLRAILALNGFPKTTLNMIIHLARICDDADLRRILRYQDWNIDKSDTTVKEWGARKVERLILENAVFRAGIVNLFYEGASISILHEHFSSREITRLSSMRMSFKPHSLIETLVDYGLYYEHAQSVGRVLHSLSKQLEN